MKSPIFVGLILFFLIIAGIISAQEDTVDIYDMDFTELSKLKIVTASKTEQEIKPVPSTIIIITVEQIKQNGYFTLEEVLADLPGFQFRNILGINSYVFQRGIPNQNNLTLLLIDGIMVNELNSGGFYGGAQYNLSNVERIEIIAGPASVAYGTNAVTGIINIITKAPTENKFEIKSGFGSFNTYESNVNFMFYNPEKNFGITVSGMLKNSDKADLKGAAGDNNWTDLMDNFERDYAADLKIQFKDFTFGTGFINKRASTATYNKSVGTIYRDYGTEWNICFLNNYLKFSRNLTPKLHLSSLLYNRNATVMPNSVYSVLDTALVGYYRPNNLTGFENILHYTACDFFAVTGGLTFEYEFLSEKASYSYSDSAVLKPPRPDRPNLLNNYLASVFVEPRLTLFKNIYISGGVRFDYSSIYNQVLTPRAGVSYVLGRHLFRFSYAQAFRAPKPWDYTDGLGNADLMPEKMQSLELSFVFNITRKVNFTVTGYNNKLENAITTQYIGDAYRWYNIGEINIRGAEASFGYSSRKIRASLNYTFTNSCSYSDPIAEISPHCTNAMISYFLNEYFSLNLRAHYVGQRENPKTIQSTGSNFVDAFIVFDGAFSLLNYKNFTSQLVVKNILNQEYYHTSNRDPDRYRQPQRTILLSVAYVLHY